MKNLLQRKTKLEIQMKPTKEPRKKQTEGSPVFPTNTELKRSWDIDISWKSRSSTKLKLTKEKLK